MKFLENKYTALYYRIIYRAKARTEILSYTEKHHILPRSLGGDNSGENLVVLTGREHFICHILLTKMTEGRARHSMIHAAVGMKRARTYQDRYINGRLYEAIKQEYAKIAQQRNIGKSPSAETRAKMSIAARGRSKTDAHKEKISIANRGKTKGPMRDEEKLKRSIALRGRASHKKGKICGPQHTIESKAKIAESNRKRVYSDETRAKLSAAAKAQSNRRREEKSRISFEFICV